MKVFVITFGLMMASINALPNIKYNEIESAIRSGDERIVTGPIVSAIEDAAQAIADAGLDPLHINQEMIYALPVPTIFHGQAYVDNFLFTGLSNIVVNRMNYAVLTSRLTFNIELPEVALRVVGSEADANLFGNNLYSYFSGSLVIKNIVLTGDVRVSVGIISGISIRSLDIGFSVGRIESDMNLVLQQTNLSAALNRLWGETIPTTLKEYERDINLLLSIVGKDLADQLL